MAHVRTASVLLLGGLAVLGACSLSGSGASGRGRPAPACCAVEGQAVATRHRLAAIDSRRFTHAELWAALEPHLRRPAIRATTIGQSMQGRALRAVTFGTGGTTVLLWSQMHGDESTATMSLADIIAWLGADGAAHDALRQRIASRLTVVMVPMLNPDGAELFQRQNAAGVDVNRDARRLSTPEARALKALRDSIGADYGFNLHDQSARTLAGAGGAQVGIALLAPAADSSRAYGPVRGRARLLAAHVASVVRREIPGQLARYDDSFEPRAFGDLMQRWGTSTVLIESGALAGDPEKQRLRAINVVAILTALDAIATGAHLDADAAEYESLPRNRRATADVLVRGGALVLPGMAPMSADLTLVYEEAVAKLRPRVQEVGDLPDVVAMDTVDATGLFLHPVPASLEVRDGRSWLRVDTPAHLILRRGREPSSEVVRVIGG